MQARFLEVRSAASRSTAAMCQEVRCIKGTPYTGSCCCAKRDRICSRCTGGKACSCSGVSSLICSSMALWCALAATAWGCCAAACGAGGGGGGGGGPHPAHCCTGGCSIGAAGCGGAGGYMWCAERAVGCCNGTMAAAGGAGGGAADMDKICARNAGPASRMLCEMLRPKRI